MTVGRGPNLAWRDGDVVLVSATALVGLIAIAAASFGAAGASAVSDQTAWLNIAVTGFAISAAGNALWLLRVRRAVGERRTALVALEPMDNEVPAGPAQGARSGQSPTSTATLQLVCAVGMVRLHQPDCPLVAGKHVRLAAVGDGELCGVCGS